jgi:signal transduction histidine kinase
MSCKIQEMVEQGKDRFDTWHKCKDGRVIDLGVSIVIMSPEETPLVAAFVRDITERKEAEREIQRSRQELRALAAHLQSIREDERITISREIHDEFGQILSVLKMDLAMIESEVQKGKASLNADIIFDEIKSMYNLMDRSALKISELISSLRPEILDNLGLFPALEWLTEDFQNRTGIKCSFKSELDKIDLDNESSIAIFRILQESLTNVSRHSNSDKVEIEMKIHDDCLCVIVSDNGIGISEEDLKNPKSFGLLGMKERAIILGGDLHISNKNDKGTIVDLTVPINSELI